MVDIIRLNADPHAKTKDLLPWYATGKLETKDRAQVERHLSECAECRKDLELEQAMLRQIRVLARDVPRGWAALKARVERAQTAARKVVPLGPRRIPGWAVAAQAASFLVLVPLIAYILLRPLALYRALGAAPSVATGNLVVVFKPDSSEATLRTILKQIQARIVDGPTSADAYVLHVPESQRGAILARLQRDDNISLAEPIDEGRH
jgi:anti-sigma factor RsiW